MARLIPVRDPTEASLEQCSEALSVWGFDPAEEESVSHAANWLARLGNNRSFLGDRLIDLLAGRNNSGNGTLAVDVRNLHRVVLAPPGRGHFTITAHLWPSQQEAMLRASGSAAFGYGVAHDHNHDFLTLGYFGPGCSVDDYEYDYETVVGWRGEPVQLRALGRSTHEQGRLVHYRASRDIHCQHPPQSLSVSLTLAHSHPVQGWLDHYVFDTEAGTIARVLERGPSEAFLRIAVALGSEEAKELAARFGRHHPSDRMRIAAWRALASTAGDAEARDSVWREAEVSGGPLVATAARLRREMALRNPRV